MREEHIGRSKKAESTDKRVAQSDGVKSAPPIAALVAAALLAAACGSHPETAANKKATAPAIEYFHVDPTRPARCGADTWPFEA